MDIKLSITVPIYNAESFILETLTRLTEWKRNNNDTVQIILVDDGSTDTTCKIVESYITTEDSSFELLSYKMNKGKGFAVKKGMLFASGEYKIFTDADIPFGFEAIEDVFYQLDFEGFDVCIGNRKSIHSTYFVKVGLLRNFASNFFTMIISRYVITGVNDTQCGLKGFKGDVADRLFSKLQTKGFAFDVELLYLSYKYELEIKRIPVVFEGNHESTVGLFRNSFQMLKDILRLPFRYHFSNKYQ